MWVSGGKGHNVIGLGRAFCIFNIQSLASTACETPLSSSLLSSIIAVRSSSLSPQVIAIDPSIKLSLK